MRPQNFSDIAGRVQDGDDRQQLFIDLEDEEVGVGEPEAEVCGS